MNEWIDDHPPIIPELGIQSLPIQLATMVHIHTGDISSKKVRPKNGEGGGGQQDQHGSQVSATCGAVEGLPRGKTQQSSGEVGVYIFGIMYETQCHKQLPFGDVKDGFWHWIYHVTPSKKLMLITAKWLIVGMVH